jgi:hypothetical protein
MIRNDLISRLHSVDNGLADAREGSKRGRAKWFRESNEQIYDPDIRVPIPDPQIEVYYRNLGLSLTREVRNTISGLLAR